MMRNIPRHQYLLIFGIVCIISGLTVLMVPYIDNERDPSPVEILTEARITMSKLQSYRSDISFSYSQDDSAGNIMKTVEYSAPGYLHSIETFEESWIEYLYIDGEDYYRASYHTDWLKNPQYVMDDGTIRLIPISDSDYLYMLDNCKDIERLPDKRINDLDLYHYRADISPEIDIDENMMILREELSKMDKKPPGMENLSEEEILEQYLAQYELLSRTKVYIEIWIYKKPVVIRQLKIYSQSPPTDSEQDSEGINTSLLVKYYDFNVPVEIITPDNAQ